MKAAVIREAHDGVKLEERQRPKTWPWGVLDPSARLRRVVSELDWEGQACDARDHLKELTVKVEAYGP